MFVALNIHQRHQSHLHTAFSVRKDQFEYVAQELSHLSPDIINSVAKHLESEGKITDLSDSQRKVLTLLNEVNTVSAKIPGSSASQIDVCKDIRAYMGYFGLPHIYTVVQKTVAMFVTFHLLSL